jgi:hypothetical protein
MPNFVVTELNSVKLRLLVEAETLEAAKAAYKAGRFIELDSEFIEVTDAKIRVSTVKEEEDPRIRLKATLLRESNERIDNPPKRKTRPKGEEEAAPPIRDSVTHTKKPE